REDWDVTVLTSDPDTFRPGTPRDDALLTRIPDGVRVVRAPSVRGFERLKMLARRRPPAAGGTPASTGAPAAPREGGRRPRGLAARAVDTVDTVLAIPDQESAWLLPAIARGLAAARGRLPDVLYSSAPPWTGHLVAHALAKMLRCPWVAD